MPVSASVARRRISRALRALIRSSGSAASAVKKTYTAREDVIGKVVKFDGDLFRVEFRQLNPRKPKVVKSRWSA